MNPLRSVGARLSLALLIVVAAALGIVYLVVVPSLERRLVNGKLDQLEQAAPSLARQLPENRLFWRDFVENARDSVNARVVIYDVYEPPPTLQILEDSRTTESSADVADDPVALRSAVEFRGARGTVVRGGTRYAEVATPTLLGPHILLLASLNDSLANGHFVRRRLLTAGLIALVVTLALGYGGAWAFARRIRRLEAAVGRIATGHFDEPVVDAGADELGQLARAFDNMRLRLARLDRARGEFIANASHELRTPLFSLAGFLELLTDEELDEATRAEFLATMREQVERLAKLATELLDLSRLDVGRMQVERSELDLAPLAEALAAEFRAFAQSTGHSVEAVAWPSATALGDEGRVLQIGRVLVENALLHTPAGTTVRVGADEGELWVEDDGPGVPPEHAGQIFERFYRLDSALASGSGLGLAIARELAELMGGTLELDSRPGRTVFTLALPGEAFSRENEPEDPVATV